MPGVFFQKFSLNETILFRDERIVKAPGTVGYIIQSIPINCYSINRYTINRYTINRYTINRYTINRYAINRYTINRYAINRYTINRYENHDFAKKMMIFEKKNTPIPRGDLSKKL